MKPNKHASDRFSHRVQALLGRRFTESDKAFILGGRTYAEIYELAAGIATVVSRQDACVCLCAEDKGVFAASVLAALSHGFKLVLPYAHSEQALQEVFNRLNRDQIKTSVAIVDQPRPLPRGIRPLTPEPRSVKSLGSQPAIPPDDPFCLFFTGGSTGKPKIWSKTPRNLLAEAFHLARKYDLSAHDRIVACAPPFHLYGFTFAVLLPLVSSASVAPDIYTYPEEIRQALDQYNASVFIGAPMHYRVLKEGPLPSSSLRLAFSSTGKLNPTDGAHFQEQTGADLVEIYGSTETGVIAARCRARGEEAFKPLDVVEWKIVNQGLYVRSPFTPPEVEKDAEGYFDMGDRVRMYTPDDPRAGFELVGRADGIVKVGGKRVDLEEIRQKIIGLPKVEDAVVIARPSAKGRENNISALVQGDVGISPLRQALAAHLEPYAMPRRIKIISAIPMAPTGKYDRRAIEALLG